MCADQDGAGFHAHGAGRTEPEGDAAGDRRGGSEKGRRPSEPGAPDPSAGRIGRAAGGIFREKGSVG